MTKKRKNSLSPKLAYAGVEQTATAKRTLTKIVADSKLLQIIIRRIMAFGLRVTMNSSSIRPNSFR